ncbi:MAG TPA: class I SAM-dependent methyltransferase [Albitalea sp.]|uniref:class I SAM-dependent methyltransferase n=1 Tax=Piscinibacter sp. TaxID=1903157 RepID=UPI002ED5EDDA
MNDAEFDRFARRYRDLHKANIAITGEEPEYFADYKMRDFRAHLERAGLPADGTYLDFGCGTGASIAPFLRHLPGARLTCADVSTASLDEARARHGDVVRYELIDDGDGGPPSCHDGAFANCVFHHIAPAAHAAALSSLRRRLKPGGLLMVYEHNPLNPLTVRAVRTCPLDENAILIRAGRWRAMLAAHDFTAIRIDFRVFFPAALKRLRPLEDRLRWLPLGAQYCVTARSP